MARKSWYAAWCGLACVVVGIVCVVNLELREAAICAAVFFGIAYLCYLVAKKYNRVWKEHEDFQTSWLQRDAYSMMTKWAGKSPKQAADEGLEKMPEAVTAWRKYGYRQVVTMLTRLRHYEHIDGLIRMESGPIMYTFLFGYMSAAAKYEKLQKRAEKIEQQRKENAGIRKRNAELAEENEELQVRLGELQEDLDFARSSANNTETGLVVKYIKEVTRLKEELARYESKKEPEPDMVAQMIADQEAGMSFAKIGEKYGMTKEQVRYQIRKRKESISNETM